MIVTINISDMCLLYLMEYRSHFINGATEEQGSGDGR